MNLSSTLVETVSIDYEDFNESFLTCGTCLCTFDGAKQTPKLLPCSHTICLECLTRYCTALHCTALHCTTMQFTALYNMALHCIVLYCTAWY